jgi:hypothetical protein
MLDNMSVVPVGQGIIVVMLATRWIIVQQKLFLRSEVFDQCLTPIVNGCFHAVV